MSSSMMSPNKTTIICQICGKEKIVYKSVAKRGVKYCSRDCANKGMTTKKTVPCVICGRTLIKKPSTPNKRFCSKVCMGVWQLGQARNPKTGEIKTCEHCGKEYYIQKSRADKSQFCSKHCQIYAYLPSRTGENSQWFKGGICVRYKDGQPYQILLGQGPRRKGGSEIPFHRHIVQEVLGRKLRPNEVVHHIDRNGLNNQNDNLLLCDRSYHSMLHHRMGDFRRNDQK